MAERRTRMIISVPWDDDGQDHPAQWGWDALLGVQPDSNGLGVVVIDWAETDMDS